MRCALAMLDAKAMRDPLGRRDDECAALRIRVYCICWTCGCRCVTCPTNDRAHITQRSEHERRDLMRCTPRCRFTRSMHHAAAAAAAARFLPLRSIFGHAEGGALTASTLHTCARKHTAQGTCLERSERSGTGAHEMMGASARRCALSLAERGERRAGRRHARGEICSVQQARGRCATRTTSQRSAHHTLRGACRGSKVAAGGSLTGGSAPLLVPPSRMHLPSAAAGPPVQLLLQHQ